MTAERRMKVPWRRLGVRPPNQPLMKAGSASSSSASPRPNACAHRGAFRVYFRSGVAANTRFTSAFSSPNTPSTPKPARNAIPDALSVNAPISP